MSLPRPSPVLVVIALAVAGCGAHPGPSSSSPTPPGTSPSPAQATSPPRGPARSGDANAGDDAPPPDQDGNPACAAYDSWRLGPNGAGIIVTFWYDGHDPVTALVRHPGGPDLSQTVDDDISQRHHDFEFLDVAPNTVTEVLVTTGDRTCFVRAAPPS